MPVISVSDKEGNTHKKLKGLRIMGDANSNPSYYDRSISYIALRLIESEESIDKVIRDIQDKTEQ